MQFKLLFMLLFLLIGCKQATNQDTFLVGGVELCGNRSQILSMLSVIKQEKLIKDSGISFRNVQLELTSSNRTISVLASWPEGISCVIASGVYIITKLPGQEM